MLLRAWHGLHHRGFAVHSPLTWTLPSVPAPPPEVITDHPFNNVTDSIFQKIGVNLHQQPAHPIGIIKGAIYDYFDQQAGGRTRSACGPAARRLCRGLCNEHQRKCCAPTASRPLLPPAAPLHLCQV